MVSYEDFEALVTVLVFAILGIILSMIATTVYNAGYFVKALVAMQITIEEVRIGIIVLCFVVGIIIAAIKR